MVFGGGGGGELQRPGTRDHCSPVSEVAEQTDCLCAQFSTLKSPVTLKHHRTSKMLLLSDCSAQDYTSETAVSPGARQTNTRDKK